MQTDPEVTKVTKQEAEMRIREHDKVDEGEKWQQLENGSRNYLEMSRASQTVDSEPQPIFAFNSYLRSSTSPGFAG
jgi:hypothetical protein